MIQSPTAMPRLPQRRVLVLPQQPGFCRRVVGDAAAEDVADEGLDGVGFGEGHGGRVSYQSTGAG